MNISKQAKKMSEENNLDPEINQAYIDNVGAEYATAEEVQEAYQVENQEQLNKRLGVK